MRRWTSVAGFVLCLVLAWAAPAAAQTEGDADTPAPTALRGTIRLGFDQYFEDVEITVADPSGTVIGQTATDSDGRWSVEVPGAGTYVVTLDESTLPEEMGLREGYEPIATATVAAGMSRAVVFAVGEAAQGNPIQRASGSNGVQRLEVRPDHRHERHWPVAHLRDHRPGQLRPRGAGDLWRGHRLVLQQLLGRAEPGGGRGAVHDCVRNAGSRGWK